MKRITQDLRYLAWIVFILIIPLSVIPVGGVMKGTGIMDKIFHSVAFYFLVFFFSLSYGWDKKWKFFIIVVSLAAVVEFLQLFIPWRDASFVDFGTSFTGALLAGVTPSRFSGRIIEMIGSFFYIGALPLAPATFASFATLLIYYILPFRSSFLLLFIPVTFIVGLWISEQLSHYWGNDPGKVVIDEIVGVLIAVVFYPKILSVIVLGFLLFRLFDIWKPFFVKELENLPGGWGIMLDDVGSGVLANLSIFVIMQIGRFQVPGG